MTYMVFASFDGSTSPAGVFQDRPTMIAAIQDCVARRETGDISMPQRFEALYVPALDVLQLKEESPGVIWDYEDGWTDPNDSP